MFVSFFCIKVIYFSSLSITFSFKMDFAGLFSAAFRFRFSSNSLFSVALFLSTECSYWFLLFMSLPILLTKCIFISEVKVAMDNRPLSNKTLRVYYNKVGRM